MGDTTVGALGTHAAIGGGVATGGVGTLAVFMSGAGLAAEFAKGLVDVSDY